MRRRRTRTRLVMAVQWGLWIITAFMVCMTLWWLASGALP
jgi:hypothetical protein